MNRFYFKWFFCWICNLSSSANCLFLDCQSRIFQETKFISLDGSPHQQGSENEAWIPQQPRKVQDGNQPWPDGPKNQTSREPRPINEDEYLRELDGLKAKYAAEDTDKEMSLQDCDASCLATCSTGDVEDDPFKGSYTCEVEEVKEDDESGALTSCVATRWFRAPELLYGSTNYGLEIDLWSLGCIFAELLSLKPLFPGTSDIDQLGKIISVLGDLTEKTWTGCSKLPDYNKIFFSKVENPIGLEACLQNRSAAEVNLVRWLLCYDPSSRVSAMELLQDRYFAEGPLPVPVDELRVPSTKDGHDESSPGEWADYRDLVSDSNIDEFGGMDVTTTEKGLSIRFS